MKKCIPLTILAFVFLAACDSTQPLTITANPDQTTATSGTASSARFTDGAIHKPSDTLTTGTDTARIKRDNPPR